jgi:hypothetical protein
MKTETLRILIMDLINIIDAIALSPPAPARPSRRAHPGPGQGHSAPRPPHRLKKSKTA